MTSDNWQLGRSAATQSRSRREMLKNQLCFARLILIPKNREKKAELNGVETDVGFQGFDAVRLSLNYLKMSNFSTLLEKIIYKPKSREKCA